MSNLRLLGLAAGLLIPFVVGAQGTVSPLDRLRAETAKLAAIQCDASTPAAVRDLNERLLDRRRSELALLVEQRIAELKEYVAHAGVELTAADTQDVQNALQPLEVELARAQQPIAALCQEPTSLDRAPRQVSSLAPDTTPSTKLAAMTVAVPARSDPPRPTDAAGGSPQPPRADSSAGALTQTTPTTPATTSTSSTTTETTKESDYLLGPVRAYFSGGAVLAADNGQFQNSAVFIALNVDDTWYSHFHTFFDARLTTAPVTSCVQNTATTSGCAASSSGFIDTFNSSKKSALISAGGYFPLAARTWGGKESDPSHKLFFAPLFKGGVQTLVDPPQTITNPVGGAQTTIATLNNQTFFHYYAAGARLGLWELPVAAKSGQEIPPDPILYLDIVGGQYENFAKTDPMTGKILGHPWRLGLEGRFRVPKVPFIVGFDSNTKVGNSPGDLRFLFGTTFDIGCLFQKLTLPQNTTSVAGCSGSGK